MTATLNGAEAAAAAAASRRAAAALAAAVAAKPFAVNDAINLRRSAARRCTMRTRRVPIHGDCADAGAGEPFLLPRLPVPARPSPADRGVRFVPGIAGPPPSPFVFWAAG